MLNNGDYSDWLLGKVESGDSSLETRASKRFSQALHTDKSAEPASEV